MNQGSRLSNNRYYNNTSSNTMYYAKKEEEVPPALETAEPVPDQPAAKVNGGMDWNIVLIGGIIVGAYLVYM